MAIPIHTSPELTGESAELFVKEAESRPVFLGKLRGNTVGIYAMEDTPTVNLISLRWIRTAIQ